MAKKILVFAVMVVVSVMVILALVGWTRTNHKREPEKKKVKMITPQKLQEVRIVAVEEKILSPKKKIIKKKKVSAPKKQKKTAEKKKPVNRKAPTKKVRMTRTTIKRSEKNNIRPKTLLPANFRLNRHMIEVGHKLIDNTASVPIVQASYKRIGFESYLKKMMELGGRLFLGDAKDQKILAEITVANNYGRYSFLGLDAGKKDDLDGMALFRPREISGELLIDEILKYSWQYFRDGDLRCVILLPMDREAAILGALKGYLDSSGYKISQFDLVWGNYFQTGWQFGLKVNRGRISKTGEIINLDMIMTM